MENLPVDIKIIIIEKLIILLRQDRKLRKSAHNRPRLAPYACINKSFNQLVEYYSFQHLFVTAPDLIGQTDVGSTSTGRFKQMMERDGGRRKKYVHRIWFTGSLEFPLSSSEAHSECGSAANDKAFSESLRNFWQILAEWPTTDRRLRLNLHHAPIQKHGPETLPSSKEEAFLNIIDVVSWPRVHCVSDFGTNRPWHLSTSLEASDIWDWRIWPVSLMHLLTAMEGLSGVAVQLHDESSADLPLWQEYRTVLGQNLHMLPKTCERFEAFITLRTSDQPASMPRGTDHLCVGLRNLSTQLRWLRLHDFTISPSLFWPSQDEDPSGSPAPYWPNLKGLSLIFDRTDCYGERFDLFESERSGAGFERQAAIKENLNALQVAMGHAVRRMPALEELYVSMSAGQGFLNRPELRSWVADRAETRDNALVVKWYSKPDVNITELSDEALAAWNVKKEQLDVRRGGTRNTVKAVIEQA